MNKMPKRVSSGTLILLLAVVLIVTSTVGYTVAWLADVGKLETVVFTDSDVKIVFEDGMSDETVKMIPGFVVNKAPTVTVEAGSEKCYLFIKVDESIGDDGEVLLDDEGNEIAVFDDFLTYYIIEAGSPEDEVGWVQLTDENGENVDSVYYRIVDTNEEDQVYSILGGGEHYMGTTEYTWTEGQILINPEITLEMLSYLNEDNCPELSFVAYAIQYFKSNDVPFEAYEAWAKVSASNNK